MSLTKKEDKKAFFLDLPVLKKQDIKASQVFDALSELQKLIDEAATDTKKTANWESVKENLKNLKP